MKLETKAIIAQKVLLNVLSVFTSSFFIAHLFEIAKNDIGPIALFNISFILSLSLAYFLLINMLRRGKIMLMHRLGILGHVIFLLALMILKENMMSHLIFLGLLFGFAAEAWWLPIHTFIADKVSKSEQPKFHGYLNAASGAATIITPLILGTIIQVKSFEYAAVIAVGVAFLMFLISFLIMPPKIKKGTTPFQFIAFFTNSLKDKSLINIYITEFLRGIYSGGALSVIIIIYVAYLFGSGLNLGMFLSSFAIVSIIVHIIFGNYAKYKHFPFLLCPIMLITYIVAIAFSFVPSAFTLLLYQFCFTVLVPLVTSVCSINFYNIINRPDIKKHMIEYFGAREVFLNSGRLFSFILMYIFAKSENFENLKYLLFFLTFCTAGTGFFAIIASKKQESPEQVYL